MTNFIETARMGRTNALARIGGHAGTAAAGANGRGRTTGGLPSITFTSVRGGR